MHIGFFTSIEEWGGSETYLKSLMLGVRDRGHKPLLFGIRGTRLWDEMQQAGISTVAWQEASVPSRRQQANQAPNPRIPESSNPRIPESSNPRIPESPNPRIPESSNPRIPESPNPRIHASPPRLRCLLPPWLRLFIGNMREVCRLAALFAENPVDVMHVSVSGYEVAGLACRRVGIPSVAMNMVTPPDEPYWFRRLLMRYTARRYDHVSSQSQYCTRRWAEFTGLRCDHCSFVWNGADLDRYRAGRERPPRTATDPFRLVSIGRLHPMKGYPFLVKALAQLEDADVFLLILGEGPQREELEAWIRDAGLADRVTLAGFHESPEKELAAADCFVLPSVSHESCPAVLAEAMACGLPMITSDFGPLAEVNLDGETGVVVPAGNAAALAEAIARLKADPELCAALGAAGRQRAKLFSAARMIDRTLVLYKAVLK